MRELEEKYTVSDFFVIAWRSQEVSHNMKVRFGDKPKPPKKKKVDAPAKDVPLEKRVVDPDLPDHYFNETGELDLRKVTGAEAWKYFSEQGVNLPIIEK